jgi:four helix bundle protein
MNEFKKQYDLEDRTLKFSIMTRNFIKNLPYSISNKIYIRQAIRSSSSIGANYIEANEALSDKDFLHRAKISKKEAKETYILVKSY